MKCVAYIRVSTEKQAEEGYGLDSQKRDILDYCKRNNLAVSEWYIDAGLSGMDMTKRVELQRLISDMSKIDIIVVYKLDRLARDSVDALYMIEKIFIPKGIRVESVHDFAKYDTPQEKFQTQIMAAVAEYDRNTMLLRMRGGMLERVKNGLWMGGGNTPYCYHYSKELGILVPIPERAEKANQAMELFLSGYSDEKIQHICGFRTEKIVRNILTSPVNVGFIPYKGKLYRGKHQPIFEMDRYERAQNVRRSRSKSKSISTEPNLLTGLCYCGVCGCAMRYQKWTNGRHKIYCMSRNKSMSYLPNYNHDCNNALEWATDIENQVEGEILKISLDLSSHKPKAKETRLEIMQSRLDKEQTKLKRLYKLYADGNDTILEMISEMEEKISETKMEIEKESKNQNVSEKKSLAYENIKKLADIWPDIDKKQKNLILKTIIDKIVIVNGNIEIQLKNF